MTVMALVAKLALDTKQYKDSLKEAEGLGSKFAATLKFGFKTVTTAVAGVTAGIIGIAKSLYRTGSSYNSEIANLTANFQVLLGSTEAAQKQLAELKDFAAKTPFDLAGLADATKTLLAFQVPAEQATVLLKQLGDI